jgi:hypothetical protein
MKRLWLIYKGEDCEQKVGSWLIWFANFSYLITESLVNNSPTFSLYFNEVELVCLSGSFSLPFSADSTPHKSDAEVGLKLS